MMTGRMDARAALGSFVARGAARSGLNMAALAVGFAPVGSTALACSCRPLKTDAEKREYKQSYVNRSVKLKLTSFRLLIAPDADPEAEATAEVLEQPKEGAPYPSTITVISDGGDEGANCGRASALFTAASQQRWIRALVAKTQGARYGLGGCSPIEIEPWPDIGAAIPDNQ